MFCNLKEISLIRTAHEFFLKGKTIKNKTYEKKTKREMKDTKYERKRKEKWKRKRKEKNKIKKKKKK